MRLENELKTIRFQGFRTSKDLCCLVSWIMTLCSLVYGYCKCTTQHTSEHNVITKLHSEISYTKYFTAGPFITPIPSATEVLEIQTVMLEISTAWDQGTRETFLLRSWVSR
jgi:hypothetical protein